MRHCGCKGLHPLGLTRAIVRASLMHDGFPQSLFNVVWNGTRALTGELMSRCATRGFTEKMGSAMVRAALMHVWHYIYVYVNISATPGKLHKEASQGRRSTREAPHAKLYKGSSTREAPQGKTRKGISTREAPQGNIHTRRSTREAPHGKLHEGSSTREGGANINQNGSTCHTLEDSLTLQNILYLLQKKKTHWVVSDERGKEFSKHALTNTFL